MEISRGRSQSLDFESTAFPAASSYPPTFANCRTSMYTMQGVKLEPSEAKVSRVFAMRNSLSVDSATSSILEPKKGNFITSMFGALTSIVVERFGKVPGSFMSNINSTLSVTVVPNEGIISQEFFKNLTRSCEQLNSENHNESKEFMRIAERFPSNESFYDAKSQPSHIFADDARFDPLPGKVSLNLNDNAIDQEKNGENTRERNNKTELDIKTTPSDVREEGNDRICQNNRLTMENLNTENIASMGCESPAIINTTETKPEINESCSSRSTVPKIAEDPSEDASAEETEPKSWHTVWKNVVNGMSDRFIPRTVSAESPDTEVPSKKPNLGKPRRKTCTVARGRGKGRGKSQLRRSGVSQSRHRKERTKQNIYSNIQDDLETWEELERYDDESGDDESALRCATRRSAGVASNEQRSPGQDSDCGKQRCSAIFENFCFEDSSTTMRKRKQRVRDGNSVKCPVRVRYVPESSPMEVENYSSGGFVDEVDCTSRIGDFRPRLVSESSVDSEDSYCIVFESGSDSEYTDYDFDAVSEDDLDENDETTPRVRFNLDPKVHVMFQWDFAYRAARRGPWEQMARDRERFRGRIHCIERILDPILSTQHRKCVWQERFDVDD